MDSFIPHQEVIAQYVDNVWYRARFLGYVPDSEYEQAFVLFVDWGNTAIIRDSMKVKEIPDVFAKTPSLAIKLELEVKIRTNQCISNDRVFPDRELCGGE